MAQVSSITAAVKAAGFTATGLADALVRVTIASITSEARARITVILDGLCNLTLVQVGTLMSEAVKGAKDTPQAGTVKQRASEARQVIGAVKLKQSDDFREELEGKGWHGGVSLARKVLKDAGMKWNLKPIPTDEETEKKKETAALAEVIAGMDGTAEMSVAELKEAAARQIMSKEVAAHCKRIWEAKGEEYAHALADALTLYVPSPEKK